MLEPIFEADLDPEAYGYRPQRSARDAIGRVRELLCQGYSDVVVPPPRNAVELWEFDRALYRRRNHVERLFRRLKVFRRIFSRFDKLDVMFLGFLHFALIVEAPR